MSRVSIKRIVKGLFLSLLGIFLVLIVAVLYGQYKYSRLSFAGKLCHDLKNEYKNYKEHTTIYECTSPEGVTFYDRSSSTGFLSNNAYYTNDGRLLFIDTQGDLGGVTRKTPAGEVINCQKETCVRSFSCDFDNPICEKKDISLFEFTDEELPSVILKTYFFRYVSRILL